jgi:CheY-like chemotaxis protein
VKLAAKGDEGQMAHILVVDDEPLIRLTLEMLLRRLHRDERRKKTFAVTVIVQ